MKFGIFWCVGKGVCIVFFRGVCEFYIARGIHRCRSRRNAEIQIKEAAAGAAATQKRANDPFSGRRTCCSRRHVSLGFAANDLAIATQKARAGAIHALSHTKAACAREREGPRRDARRWGERPRMGAQRKRISHPPGRKIMRKVDRRVIYQAQKHGLKTHAVIFEAN